MKEIFRARTRAEWEAFAREHDCCLEPVLELDEALDSELVRAREMVVEIEQPGAERPVRQLGIPVKLTRTPGEHGAAARARRSASTPRRCCWRPATPRREVAELLSAGAAAGRAGAAQGARSGRERRRFEREHDRCAARRRSRATAAC